MRAWLIQWDWAGDAAAVVDRVAAITNCRKSAERVAEIMELLYAQQTATIGELAAYARNPKNRPSHALIDFNSRITCGHNPWLSAQVVSELIVETDPDSLVETISYLTQPVYEPADTGLRLVRPATPESITRILTGPLSHELMRERSHNRLKDQFRHLKPPPCQDGWRKSLSDT